MKDFKLHTQTPIPSGFKTPEGYFDTLSDRIMAQLPVQEPKVIPLYRSRKLWYYAVAAILVVLLSVPLYTHYQVSSQEVDTATLENYLTTNAVISEEDIVNLLDEKDLEKLSIDLKIQDTDIEEALDTNPNLEQYILD